MERRIEDDVEQGTPLDEVMVYLSAEGEDQGIEAADHVTPAARFSQLEEAGLAPDTPVLAAILRGKGHGLQIFFIMDDGLEFREVIVKEYSDGFYIEF